MDTPSFFPKARLLALLTALLFGSSWAAAQTVNNPGFEFPFNCSPTTTAAEIAYNPFQRGCVPNWRVTHGSPQIKGDNTNKYAFMFSRDGVGEGIMTAIGTLVANRIYEVSLMSRYNSTPSPSNQIAVKITTNAYSPYYPEPDGGPYPNFNVVWATQFNPQPNVFARNTFQFSVTSTGPYYLWIYPEFWTNGITYNVNVDDVSVTNCLVGSVAFQNTSSVPDLTKTQATISAGRAVKSGPQGDVRVLAGQTVEFNAGMIELRDGFSAEPGSQFTAQFMGQGCAFSRSAGGATVDFESAEASSMQAEPSLSASPNPANDYLKLPEGVSREQVVLYAPSGKPVQLSAADHERLNVQELPEGLYMLYITKDGITTKQRIQIQH